MKTATERAEEMIIGQESISAMVGLVAAALEEKEREIEIIRQQRDEAVSAQANAESRLYHSKKVADGVWAAHEAQFAELNAKLAEAVKLLSELLVDLPTRRDWLNPDLERAIRAFVEKHKTK